MRENEKFVFRGNLVYEVFRSDDGMAVQKYHVNKVMEGANEEGKQIVVTGYALPSNKKLQYEISGEWIKHHSYGWQVRAVGCKEVVEKSKTAIIDFLSKGPFKGIGRKTAEKIYATFGEKTYDILDKDPQKLYDVKGLSQKKAAGIIQSWNENRAARDVIQILVPLGVKVSTCMKLVNAFSFMTKEILLTDPWKLTECTGGLTFEQAEHLAQHLQLPMDAPSRIINAMLAVLKNNELCGNLGMDVSEFQTEWKKALFQIDRMKYSPESIAKYQTSIMDEMRKQWQEQLISKAVIRYTTVTGEPLIYRSSTYKVEFECACKLIKLNIGAKPPTTNEVDMFMQRIKKESKFPLAPKQEEAVRYSFIAGVLVVTGGPGTGKTTTINEICRGCDYRGKSICLLAPTGKAAKRMTESTGRNATTIDSKLRIIPDTDIGEDLKIKEDVIIVDEASMVDIFKLYALLNALKPGQQLILVGDIDQLPSVGPGAVLRDIIDCGNILYVALDTVYRQAAGDDAGQRIITNAHRINEGNTKLDYGNGFHFLEINSDEKIAEKLATIYVSECKKRGVDNVVCLLPTNKTPYVGVNEMNATLQQMVNPPAAGKSYIKHGAGVLRDGDLILNTRNDYEREVVNGEVGKVVKTHVDQEKTRSAVGDFDGKKIEFKGSEALQQLTLAYALTIHKSQGSEYQSVIIGLSNSIGYNMMRRNLIYTGITRAKQEVFLVGSAMCLKRCIKTIDSYQRKTSLCFLVRQAAVHYSGKASKTF